MEYKAYKLMFQGAVHFGKQNLDEGEYSFYADTLFSALCQEALKIDHDTFQAFYHYAKDGSLLISDAFPFMDGTYYIPKPMKRIISSGNDGDSVMKKAYKKLKYIPADALDIYLRGEYDVLNAPDFDCFGHFGIKTAASVRGEQETVPYRIGMYYYNDGNGLYFIVGYQDHRALEMMEKLLEQLSFSGIGGKRASGLGRFELGFGRISDEFRKRLTQDGTRYMSLSAALPKDDELETVLEGAEYLLCKRSGFVASEKYAPEQMRKKDLYVFRAGSCFPARFCGDIYDVSDKCGRHPVYRYAKPMLMEV